MEELAIIGQTHILRIIRHSPPNRLRSGIGTGG
jgi:hypothetical protein